MSTFEDTLRDALTTVRLIPRWQLASADWSAVEIALARFEAAVEARDGRALGRALEELEDHGPSRLAAIPRTAVASSSQPPSDRILDLVNTLVHPEGGWTDAAPSRPPADDRTGT